MKFDFVFSDWSLSEFKIIKKIGSGGQASVLLVKHQNYFLVLKLIKFNKDRTNLDRMIHESELHQQLQ